MTDNSSKTEGGTGFLKIVGVALGCLVWLTVHHLMTPLITHNTFEVDDSRGEEYYRTGSGHDPYYSNATRYRLNLFSERWKTASDQCYLKYDDKDDYNSCISDAHSKLRDEFDDTTARIKSKNSKLNSKLDILMSQRNYMDKRRKVAKRLDASLVASIDGEISIISKSISELRGQVSEI